MPTKHILQTAELAGVPSGIGAASMLGQSADDWWLHCQNAPVSVAPEKRSAVAFYAVDDLIQHRLTTVSESAISYLDANVFVNPDHTPVEGLVRVVPVTFGSTEGRIRLSLAARAVEGELSLDDVLGAWHGLESPSLERESKAFAALSDLRRWLRLSVAEAAELVGFGRTTPSSWVRAGHEPQPARARRLYQTHAVVSALVRRFGEEETLRWFLGGSPSPRTLITQGDTEAAADSAEALLLGRQPRRGASAGALMDEDEAAPPPSGLRPTVRRRSRERTEP